MANHLKLRAAYFSSLSSSFSLLFGLWVFCVGLYLALVGAGASGAMVSGFMFWVSYLVFIIKDFFIQNQIEPVS